MPFNAQHELDRKVALNTLLNRTNGEMKEEADILKRVKEIEKRRRTENQALLQKAAAVFSTSRTTMVQNPVSIDDVREDYESLMPDLPPRGSSVLKPGAYLRGEHFITLANEQAAAAQGGARFSKRIDQCLEDLSVKTPVMNTHSVCAGWLKLREETIELLRVRKKLAAVYERLVAKGKTPGYIPGMADVEAKKAVGSTKDVPPRVASAGEIKKEEPSSAPASMLKRKATEPAGRAQKAQRARR
jgi:DNA methyltransferase 1-associated protein 1